ncbi:uncharacterized protein F5891DRAFT_1277733, partial [Suillus fuscotomentosus]
LQALYLVCNGALVYTALLHRRCTTSRGRGDQVLLVPPEVHVAVHRLGGSRNRSHRFLLRLPCSDLYYLSSWRTCALRLHLPDSPRVT